MLDLEDFKVEELEQRLEMGKWSPSVQKAPSQDDPFGKNDYYYGAKYTHDLW